VDILFWVVAVTFLYVLFPINQMPLLLFGESGKEV